MSSQEYYLVGGGWSLLIIILTIFWYATLRRLTQVLKEDLKKARSDEPVPTIPSLFVFILRGDFKETRDSRLVTLYRRLRQLLYGYLGVTIAYFVFVVLMHPRY
jgi:hypothetical protein